MLAGESNRVQQRSYLTARSQGEIIIRDTSAGAVRIPLGLASSKKAKGNLLFDSKKSVKNIASAKGGETAFIDDWNTFDIIVRGSHVLIKLNGEAIIVDANIEPMDKKGRIGLRVNDNLHQLRIRKFEIKELPR